MSKNQVQYLQGYDREQRNHRKSDSFQDKRRKRGSQETALCCLGPASPSSDVSENADRIANEQQPSNPEHGFRYLIFRERDGQVRRAEQDSGIPDQHGKDESDKGGPCG